METGVLTYVMTTDIMLINNVNVYSVETEIRRIHKHVKIAKTP